MPQRRKTARRTTEHLPAGALHLCVTGEYLGQADGERMYGLTFNQWDSFSVPIGVELADFWHQHQHAIEAHARALGEARPRWILDRLSDLKGWGMLR
ncbi:MAG: hypothetical protein IT183_14265 [Acidobacteria bacterium]|nr:hypothetical protein [Acidobacteriota bacterium]